MPVVVARAESFGRTGYETHEQLVADAALRERIDAFRRKAGQLMGLGDVARSSVPKTVLLAPPQDGGQVCTRSFIPVQPHTAIGVLAAVSVVTGMRLPGAVGHDLTADWAPDRSQIDVEHPTGHLRVDVVIDSAATPVPGGPLGRRPHGTQALRRHRLPPRPTLPPHLIFPRRPNHRRYVMPRLHEIAHMPGRPT